MGNSDIDRLCFNSKKCKIALCVRNIKSLVSPTRQNARNLTAVTETGENVLNRAIILLFNCIQSSFHCAVDFQPVFRLFVMTFEDYRFAKGSRRPSYTKSCKIYQMQ